MTRHFSVYLIISLFSTLASLLRHFYYYAFTDLPPLLHHFNYYTLSSPGITCIITLILTWRHLCVTGIITNFPTMASLLHHFYYYAFTDLASLLSHFNYYAFFNLGITSESLLLLRFYWLCITLASLLLLRSSNPASLSGQAATRLKIAIFRRGGDDGDRDA